jgi:hypothetical protein
MKRLPKVQQQTLDRLIKAGWAEKRRFTVSGLIIIHKDGRHKIINRMGSAVDYDPTET